MTPTSFQSNCCLPKSSKPKLTQHSRRNVDQEDRFSPFYNVQPPPLSGLHLALYISALTKGLSGSCIAGQLFARDVAVLGSNVG